MLKSADTTVAISTHLNAYEALRLAATCKSIRAQLKAVVHKRTDLIPKRAVMGFVADLQTKRYANAMGTFTVCLSSSWEPQWCNFRRVRKFVHHAELRLNGFKLVSVDFEVGLQKAFITVHTDAPKLLIVSWDEADDTVDFERCVHDAVHGADAMK